MTIQPMQEVRNHTNKERMMKLFEAVMKIDTFRWEGEYGKKPASIRDRAGWFFKFSNMLDKKSTEQSFNGKWAEASKAAKKYAKKAGYDRIELLT